jgi:hypothetical protein
VSLQTLLSRLSCGEVCRLHCWKVDMITSMYSQTVAYSISATFIRNQSVGGPTPSSSCEAAGDGATPASTDRTTLSPEARGVERRSANLFAALDADKDGSITEQEFTGGALELLRNARHRPHGHRHGQGVDRSRSAEAHARHEAKLLDKLERVFSKVDADGDGSITRDELTSALSEVQSQKAHRTGSAATATAGTPPSEEGTGQTGEPVEGSTASGQSAEQMPVVKDVGSPTTQTETFTATRVTFVAVAVQRYTWTSSSQSAGAYA